MKMICRVTGIGTNVGLNLGKPTHEEVRVLADREIDLE